MAAQLSEEEALRDRVIQVLRNGDYPRIVNTNGFEKMFEKITNRVDISPDEKKLTLKIFVSQAFIHVTKWGSEVGYEASGGDGQRSSYFAPIMFDYDPEYQEEDGGPRDDWEETAEENCVAWFKNPNHIAKRDAENYGVSVRRFSWVRVNVRNLLAKKHALMQAVRRQFRIDERHTGGIDELFEGSTSYSCYAWNPHPDLILLMESVLHYMDHLLTSYALSNTDKCRHRIFKYLKTPYIAHLDKIYKGEYEDEDGLVNDREIMVTSDED